jgi:hypothetical protein
MLKLKKKTIFFRFQKRVVRYLAELNETEELHRGDAVERALNEERLGQLVPRAKGGGGQRIGGR